MFARKESAREARQTAGLHEPLRYRPADLGFVLPSFRKLTGKMGVYETGLTDGLVKIGMFANGEGDKSGDFHIKAPNLLLGA
jgi:hypothetical protein